MPLNGLKKTKMGVTQSLSCLWKGGTPRYTILFHEMRKFNDQKKERDTDKNTALLCGHNRSFDYFRDNVVITNAVMKEIRIF